MTWTENQTYEATDSRIASAYINLQLAEKELEAAIAFEDAKRLGVFSDPIKFSEWQQWVIDNNIRVGPGVAGISRVANIFEQQEVWVDNVNPTPEELKEYISEVYEEPQDDTAKVGKFSIKVSEEEAERLIAEDSEKWKISEDQNF